MMFAQGFQSYVCPGDVITCEAGPFTVPAQVVPELGGSENAPGERFPGDCPDAPDQRQDGFWPSLYANAPGFIGPGRSTGEPSTGPFADPSHHRKRFAEAQAKAEAVIEGWRKGDWFYCGIMLSVSLEGAVLASHATSLWRIEANFPGADNSYLTAIANDLLPEAVAVAREMLTWLARHAEALEGA